MEKIALNHASRQALRALARFPLVFAAALIGTAAALVLNHTPFGSPEGRESAANLLMAAWLGVPLLLALALAAEARRWPAWASLCLQAAGVAALAAFHHSLAASPWPVRIPRFWSCMLAAHLFASLADTAAPGASSESFWRRNRSMAARLGLGAAYGALLYLGLGLGLASVKGLFEIEFPDSWFLDPGVLVLGAFLTWFFLAGVPAPAPRNAMADGTGAQPGAAGTPGVGWDRRDPSYPRQLRLVVQLILLPLACAYLAIVYAYAVRILIRGNWPTGWVTWLLLCFCGLALLCLILAQPLAERGGGRWAALYCRHFHIALAPVVLLLFAAIGKRVQEYGITENRYFVLALAVWLAGIVLHAAIDAPKDLRILPATLCLGAALAAFGPWGAFEVSRRSQIQRLEGLLESHGMLVGGKLAKAPGRIPRAAVREIGGIAGWLEDRHRLMDLEPWIPSIDDSGQTHSVAWHQALDGRFALLEALELPYLPPEAAGPGRSEAVAFRCPASAVPLRKVTGYDFLIADYGFGDAPPAEPDGEEERNWEGEGLSVAFDTATGALRIAGRDSAGPALDIAALFHKLRDRYPDAYDLNLPAEEMTLEAEDGRYKVMARLRGLRGTADAGGARLRGFAADLFVAEKGKGRPRARTAFVPAAP